MADKRASGRSRAEARYNQDLSKSYSDGLFNLAILLRRGVKESNVKIREIRLRVRSENPENYQVIVKGWQDGSPVVGFHDADDPALALSGAINRVQNNTLNLYDDDYNSDNPPAEGVGSVLEATSE